ncbi:iron complex outermembrane receptor protein [Lacibacter cauensis]|uniref:Iron complex outermembrane receptor protein n=1 Tax=Lacibacter cauensis TaxID=510947 RepID=A0A562SV06_9BACT|nr:TonB-dependent receptor [Lacibacter cauensis]TWI85101.1 iron complex outermembrane receptor protein [Lacibacter cauensis]
MSLALLGVFSNSTAQEKEIELDPITITASLTPVSASKTGRNILIIKGDALQKLPVQSIDELLRYVPGVEVQSRGPMGAQGDITIRGGTFQQVLVILDGIRLNDPLTGHFNSYIPISPAEIDRIEILKGASSAIYGTEAVGGVVHIISKTFAAKKQSNGHKINAQLTAGDYGLFNTQAGISMHQENTTASVGVLTNNAKGQPLRGTKGYFNLTTISASIKQQLNENTSVAYRFGYDDRAFNAQNFYTTFLSDSATEAVVSRWHHFKLQYQKNKHRFSFDAGYKQADDVYRFRKAVSPNVNNSSLFQSLAIHDYTINDKSSITSGVQFISRKITSNDRGNHEVSNAGAFVVLNQKIGENLQLNPALRVDWNERSGWEIIPQLNASYRMESILFRGSLGRTTRDADFTERFNNYQRNPVPSGQRIGNPDLTSETSFSYEFGADYFITPSFKLSTTWFERFQDDLIDYVTTPYATMPRQVNLTPGGTYLLTSNINKVNTTGIETDVQYTHQFTDDHSLAGGLGFIWMRSRSSDTVPSLYVSNHARELINFNVIYRYKKLGFSVNGLYKNRRAQPIASPFVPISKDYFLLSTRVDLFLLKNKLAVFVQVDNIFNKRYSDLLGSVMPQRWVMGGVKVNL